MKKIQRTITKKELLETEGMMRIKKKKKVTTVYTVYDKQKRAKKYL